MFAELEAVGLPPVAFLAHVQKIRHFVRRNYPRENTDEEQLRDFDDILDTVDDLQKQIVDVHEGLISQLSSLKEQMAKNQKEHRRRFQATEERLNRQTAKSIAQVVRAAQVAMSNQLPALSRSCGGFDPPEHLPG